MMHHALLAQGALTDRATRQASSILTTVPGAGGKWFSSIRTPKMNNSTRRIALSRCAPACVRVSWLINITLDPGSRTPLLRVSPPACTVWRLTGLCGHIICNELAKPWRSSPSPARGKSRRGLGVRATEIRRHFSVQHPMLCVWLPAPGVVLIATRRTRLASACCTRLSSCVLRVDTRQVAAKGHYSGPDWPCTGELCELSRGSSCPLAQLLHGGPAEN